MTLLDATLAGDVDAVLAALAELPPAERSASAGPLLKRYVAWHRQVYETGPEGGRTVHPEGTDAQREAVALAALASATAEQLAAQRGFGFGAARRDVLERVAPLRPPWLGAEGIEHLAAEGQLPGYLLAALLKGGHLPWPQGEHALGVLVEVLGGHPWSDRPLEALLRESPGLLESGLPLRLFAFEGGPQTSLAAADKYRGEDHQWAPALLALVASGDLDREATLDATLAALARDHAAFRAGWFQRFHDALGVTAAERAARSDDYLRLLGSAIPATVALALREVEALARAHAVEPTELAHGLGPALLARGKGVVKRAARLLVRVVDAESVAAAPTAARHADPHAAAPRAAERLLDALVHPAVDVQAALLDHLETLRPALESARFPLDERLSALAPDLAPSLRDRVSRDAAADRAREASADMAGTPSTESSARTPPVGEPLPVPEPPPILAPPPTVEDTLAFIGEVLEAPDEPLGLERALDAMARFPERVDARLAGPLAKRVMALGKVDPWAHPLRAALLPAIRFWLDPERSAPPPDADLHPCDDDPSPTASGAARVTERSLWGARVAAVTRRIDQGVALPSLATPTHPGGFVDLATLEARVARWENAGRPVDPDDAALAVLRLPVADTAAMAERFPDAIADAGALAKVRVTFGVEVTPTDTGHTHRRVVIRERRTPDSLRTPWLRLLGHPGVAGSDGLDAARWRASLTPGRLDAVFAHRVRELEYDQGPAPGWVTEPLLEPWARPGPSGHWLLALHLAANGTEAFAMAVDAATVGLGQGRWERWAFHVARL